MSQTDYLWWLQLWKKLPAKEQEIPTVPGILLSLLKAGLGRTDLCNRFRLNASDKSSKTPPIISSLVFQVREGWKPQQQPGHQGACYTGQFAPGFSMSPLHSDRITRARGNLLSLPPAWDLPGNPILPLGCQGGLLKTQQGRQHIYLQEDQCSSYLNNNNNKPPMALQIQGMRKIYWQSNHGESPINTGSRFKLNKGGRKQRQLDNSSHWHTLSTATRVPQLKRVSCKP